MSPGVRVPHEPPFPLKGMIVDNELVAESGDIGFYRGNYIRGCEKIHTRLRTANVPSFQGPGSIR